MSSKVNFRKNYVECAETKVRARVWYSNGERCDGRTAVTLYEKPGIGHNLRKIFANFQNETDIMTDYFEDDKVTFFKGNPLYDEALKMVKGN